MIWKTETLLESFFEYKIESPKTSLAIGKFNILFFGFIHIVFAIFYKDILKWMFFNDGKIRMIFKLQLGYSLLLIIFYWITTEQRKTKTKSSYTKKEKFIIVSKKYLLKLFYRLLKFLEYVILPLKIVFFLLFIAIQAKNVLFKKVKLINELPLFTLGILELGFLFCVSFLKIFYTRKYLPSGDFFSQIDGKTEMIALWISLLSFIIGFIAIRVMKAIFLINGISFTFLCIFSIRESCFYYQMTQIKFNAVFGFLALFFFTHAFTDGDLNSMMKSIALSAPFLIMILKKITKNNHKTNFMDEIAKNQKFAFKILLTESESKMEEENYIWKIIQDHLESCKDSNCKCRQKLKEITEEKEKLIQKFSLEKQFEDKRDSALESSLTKLDWKLKNSNLIEKFSKNSKKNLIKEIYYSQIKSLYEKKNSSSLLKYFIIYWLFENRLVLCQVLSLLNNLKKKANNGNFKDKLLHKEASFLISKELSKYSHDRKLYLVRNELENREEKSEKEIRELGARPIDLARVFNYKTKIKSICNKISLFASHNQNLNSQLQKEKFAINSFAKTVLDMFKLSKKIQNEFRQLHEFSNNYEYIHIYPYFFFLFTGINQHRSAAKVLKIFRQRQVALHANLQEQQKNYYASNSVHFLIENEGKEAGSILDAFGDTKLLGIKPTNIKTMKVEDFLPDSIKKQHSIVMKQILEEPLSTSLGFERKSFIKIPGRNIVIPCEFELGTCYWPELGFKFIFTTNLKRCNEEMYIILDKEENIDCYSLNFHQVLNQYEETEQLFVKDSHLSEYCPNLSNYLKKIKNKTETIFKPSLCLRTYVIDHTIEEGQESLIFNDLDLNQPQQKDRKEVLTFRCKSQLKNLSVWCKMEQHTFLQIGFDFRVIAMTLNDEFNPQETDTEKEEENDKYGLGNSSQISDFENFDLSFEEPQAQKLPNLNDTYGPFVGLNSISKINSLEPTLITNALGTNKQPLEQIMNEPSSLEENTYKTDQSVGYLDLGFKEEIGLSPDLDPIEIDKKKLPRKSNKRKSTFKKTKLFDNKKKAILGETASVYSVQGSSITKKFYSFEDATKKNAGISKALLLGSLYIFSIIILGGYTYYLQDLLRQKTQDFELGNDIVTNVYEHVFEVDLFYHHLLRYLGYQKGLIKKDSLARFNFSKLNVEENWTNYKKLNYSLSDMESYSFHLFEDVRWRMEKLIKKLNVYMSEMSTKREIFFSSQIQFHIKQVDMKRVNYTLPHYLGYYSLVTSAIIQIGKYDPPSITAESTDRILLFFIENQQNGIRDAAIQFLDIWQALTDNVFIGFNQFIWVSLFVIVGLLMILLGISITVLIHLRKSIAEIIYSIHQGSSQQHQNRDFELDHLKQIIVEFKNSGYYEERLLEEKENLKGRKVQAKTNKLIKKKRGFPCFGMLFTFLNTTLFYISLVVYISSAAILVSRNNNKMLWNSLKQKQAGDIYLNQLEQLNSVYSYLIYGNQTYLEKRTILEKLKKFQNEDKVKKQKILLFMEDGDDYEVYNPTKQFLEKLKENSLCKKTKYLKERLELCIYLENGLPLKGLVQSYFRMQQYLTELTNLILFNPEIDPKRIFSNPEFIEWEYAFENIYSKSNLYIEHELHELLEDFVASGYSRGVQNITVLMILLMPFSCLFTLLSITRVLNRFKRYTFVFQLVSLETLIENVDLRMLFLKTFKLRTDYFSK